MQYRSSAGLAGTYANIRSTDPCRLTEETTTSKFEIGIAFLFADATIRQYVVRMMEWIAVNFALIQGRNR